VDRLATILYGKDKTATGVAVNIDFKTTCIHPTDALKDAFPHDFDLVVGVVSSADICVTGAHVDERAHGGMCALVFMYVLDDGRCVVVLHGGRLNTGHFLRWARNYSFNEQYILKDELDREFQSFVTDGMVPQEVLGGFSTRMLKTSSDDNNRIPYAEYQTRQLAKAGSKVVRNRTKGGRKKMKSNFSNGKTKKRMREFKKKEAEEMQKAEANTKTK
jgi:hypothetical protein